MVGYGIVSTFHSMVWYVGYSMLLFPLFTVHPVLEGLHIGPFVSEVSRFLSFLMHSFFLFFFCNFCLHCLFLTILLHVFKEEYL